MKKARKAVRNRSLSIVRNVLICVLTYLLLFGMIFTAITPEPVDIKVGMPASQLIKATKDIQDTVTTEAMREAAAAAVEPSYRSVDTSVVTDVLNDLSLCFSGLKTLRTNYQASEVRTMSQTQLAKLSEDLGMSITQEQLLALVEASDETIDSAFLLACDEVRDALDSTLPEGQEAAALKSIRTSLEQQCSSPLTGLLTEAIRTCLRPNMLIDEEITEANREKARDAIVPEVRVKDEVIVREGEIVTLAQYTMIASMGILTENNFDPHLFLGVALLVLLAMLSLGVCVYMNHRELLTNFRMLLLLNLILVLVVAVSLLAKLLNSYLMPISLGLMLTALLIDPQLALFVNVILSLMSALLVASAGSMFNIVLMSVLVSPVILRLFEHKMLRTTTMLAGGIIAIVNFLVTFSFGLFGSAEMDTILLNSLYAAGGGLISAILCIAFQPVLEFAFNLATASKLIELSNPNQPLLRRLLLEASGTYHHSIIVANLAEAGCSAIGANGLLARVASYYHDIGKLKRPMYFKENQMGDNPHDRTDPRVSTAILTAHTRDGAQLAQKARIPEPVINIIRQHHGDTPVMYFYSKARELYGEDIDISAFRYDGPRRPSKEAAVVMLADTIEAATRALPNPDPEKIDDLIHKLVRQKLSDGQLDQSMLTFNDLDKITSAFSTVLTGVFHERIEYPDVSIPPRKDVSADPDKTASVQTSASEAQTPSAKPESRTAEKTPSAAAKPAAETSVNGVKPSCKSTSETVCTPAKSSCKSATEAPKPVCKTSQESVKAEAKPASKPAAEASPEKGACKTAADNPLAKNAESIPALKENTDTVTERQPVVPGACAPAVRCEEGRPIVTLGAPVPPVRAAQTDKGGQNDGH